MSRQAARARIGADSEWLTLEEATSYLGVSKPTIYRLCREGRLRYYKLGGQGGRRFRKDDLDQAIVAQIPSHVPQPRFTLESLTRAIRVGESITRGRRFTDDSADLIEEARHERTAEL